METQEKTQYKCLFCGWAGLELFDDGETVYCPDCNKKGQKEASEIYESDDPLALKS